jgi:hypothetical protein
MGFKRVGRHSEYSMYTVWGCISAEEEAQGDQESPLNPPLSISPWPAQSSGIIGCIAPPGPTAVAEPLAHHHVSLLSDSPPCRGACYTKGCAEVTAA